MTPLARLLATHGLLDQAAQIARAHGLSPGQLVAEPSAARVQLWTAIRVLGWSARNIERVFGLPAPAGLRAQAPVAAAPPPRIERSAGGAREKAPALFRPASREPSAALDGLSTGRVGLQPRTTRRLRVGDPTAGDCEPRRDSRERPALLPKGEAAAARSHERSANGRAASVASAPQRQAERVDRPTPRPLSRRPRLLGQVRKDSGDAMPVACAATMPARGPEEAGTLSARVSERVIPLARLLRGPGEQRDCRRYRDCLDTFVRVHPNASAAHCPPGCRAFVPIPRDAALQLASVGAVSQLAEAAQSKRQHWSKAGRVLEPDAEADAEDAA